jgi:hypothetical protein
VLTAVVYVVLRLFAGPMLFRNTATLCLAWRYIFLAGAVDHTGQRRRDIRPPPLLGRQLSPV